MPRRISESLIVRTGLGLACVTALALASMLTSVLIAGRAQGDAAAMNTAGLLRAQSYRLGLLLSKSKPAIAATELTALIQDFEQRLTSPLLARLIPDDPESPAATAYRTVTRRWHDELAPSLRGYAQAPSQVTDRYLDAVDGFVADIDAMTLQLQLVAERRVQWLRLVQGIALLLTLGLVLAALFKLLSDVMPPLRELMELVNRARRGDFSARASYTGSDELGLLAHTFNLMAEDLSRMYEQLEARVQQKTVALTRSNRSLQLLYQAARDLARDTSDGRDYGELLNRLRNLLGLGPVTLCLTTENSHQAYRRITSADSSQPAFCHAPDCLPCMQGSAGGQAPPPGVLSVPVREGERQYGALLLQHPPEQPPEDWQLELLEAVASHIATAVSLTQQREQRHRLALMDERAVIARELHDSLAQALSYLKIQIARLQRLVDNRAESDAIGEVVDELRQGVSAAYRQLRELLTTFRLKINASGLEPALRQTAAEFGERGRLQIGLDYRLHHCPLSPNEEIHVLQVVREALANTVHHARASSAEVHLETVAGAVQVTVLDDGIGIPDSWRRTHHYGITIMQERAASLGGTLEFQRRAEGGTRVAMRFVPAVARASGANLLSNSA